MKLKIKIAVIAMMGMSLGVNAQQQITLEGANDPNFVNKDGNVGIGTTNPENNNEWNRVLNVYGTSHSKITTSSSNVNTGIWSHNSGYYGAPAGGILGTYSNHPISFMTNKSTKMTITPSGNVGIGTIQPDMELTVNGKIHAKEVKIDLAIPAPDYVFKSDYNLRSIEEVESFIKENSHLPEIPSAKEFAENGVMQAEMDMNLLKKIEELTLYTIEQEKKIKKLEKQQKEIEELKSLVKKLLKDKN